MTKQAAVNIAGPYGARHTETEIQIQGRHGAIMFRYPQTKAGEVCAVEHLRRLQNNYGKQRKAVEQAAHDVLAALVLIVETAGDEHLQTIIGKEGVKQVRAALAKAAA
jgi:ribosomal protein L37AE/L43A